MTLPEWIAESRKLCGPAQIEENMPMETCAEIAPAGTQKALSQALDMVEVMQWRPIETAPKDGTEILLFWNGRNIVVARWATSQKEWWPLGRCTPLYGVSHWMPLPAAPETQEQIAGKE